jgi:hypothetical protein
MWHRPEKHQVSAIESLKTILNSPIHAATTSVGRGTASGVAVDHGGAAARAFKTTYEHLTYR